MRRLAMRIIDSKGRLFGMINLIDLFVVIAMIAVVGSMVSGFLLNRYSANIKKDRTLYIKVLYKEMPDDIISNKKILKPNDTDSYKTAILNNILDVRPGSTNQTKNLLVAFTVKCVVLNDQCYCGNSLIKIGSGFSFMANNYVLDSVIYGGIITDVEVVK